MATRGWAIGFWALVLLVPGGLFLLPVWFLRRRRAKEQAVPGLTPASFPASAPAPVPVTCSEASL